jgi:hypothetical protein
VPGTKMAIDTLEAIQAGGITHVDPRPRDGRF